MPICDAYITEGALSASVERQLLAKVTDLLLEHEGVDPTNEVGRKLAWVFVHRHEMYVAGAPGAEAALPLHLPGTRGPVQQRAPCRGDRGDDPGRSRGGGRRVAGSREPRGSLHLRGPGEWPAGGWQGGRILRLPDIYEIVRPGGESREAAEQVLAARRRQEAEQLFAAAGERTVA